MTQKYINDVGEALRVSIRELRENMTEETLYNLLVSGYRAVGSHRSLDSSVVKEIIAEELSR